MKTINNPKRKVSVTNQRSYFDWTDGMQVVRRGNGEIGMTESELVRFFGVTWRKLNHRLQTIIPNRSLEKASCHFLMTAIRKTALYILDP